MIQLDHVTKHYEIIKALDDLLVIPDGDLIFLIAGELTGNLCPDTSWQIMRILERVNAQGTTAGQKSLLEGFFDENTNSTPTPTSSAWRDRTLTRDWSEPANDNGGVGSGANDADPVNTLINWSKTIRSIGVIIFAILILISLFLIGNFIKLAVHGRQKEIEIM